MKKLLSALFAGGVLFLSSAMDYQTFNEGTKKEDWTCDFSLANKGTFEKEGESIKLALTDQNQCSRWKCNVEGLPANRLMYFSFYCKGVNVQSKNAGFRSYVRNLPMKYTASFSPAGSWKWTTGDFGNVLVENRFKVPADGKVEIVFELRGDAGEVIVSKPRLTKKKLVEAKDTSPMKLTVLPTQWMKNTAGIPRDIPMAMKVSVYADGKSFSGKDISFRVEHPEFVRIPGVEYKRPSRKDGFLFYPALERTKEEKECSVFKLPESMIKMLNRENVVWNNEIYVYLQSAVPAGAKGKTVFRVMEGDRELAKYEFEAESVGDLPPSRKPVKKFKTVIGYPHTSESDIQEIRRGYAAFWKSISVRPEAFSPVWFDELLPEIRKDFLAAYAPGIMIGGTNSLPLFRSLKTSGKLKGRTYPQLKDQAGNVMKWDKEPLPAIRYVIEDPDHFIWDSALKEEVAYRSKELSGIKYLCFDFEPYLLRAGYCEENRKWFAEWAKLPQTPSIQDIIHKCSSKWEKFRRYENELLVQKFAASMKKHFPEIEFRYCTDPLDSDGNKSSWCGTDPKLSAHVIEVFQCMPYFGGSTYYDVVRKNSEVLNGKQYPIIDPSEFQEQFFRKYTPEKTAQNIVATAVLDGIGIGFWHKDVFDGRYLIEIARAFAAVAEIEDLLGTENRADGFSAVAENCQRKELADGVIMEHPKLSNNLRYAFHRKGKSAVAGVLNYNESKDVIVKCKFPSAGTGLFSVSDVFARKNYGTFSGKELEEGILAEIQANGTLVLRIDPAEKAVSADISQIQLKKEAEKQIAALSSDRAFQDVKSGNSRIRWVVSGSKKETAVEVSCGSLSAQINPGDANLISMRGTDGRKTPIRSFGEVVLENSALEKPLKYQLSSTSISGGKPVVTFHADVRKEDSTNPHDFSLDGLRVVKSYTLDENGILYSLRFENNSKSNETFRIQARVKSMLDPVPVSGIPNGNTNEMLLSPGEKIELPWAARQKPTEWKDGTVRFAGGTKYETGKGIAGVYFWRSSGLITAEPITVRFDLRPKMKKSFEIRIVPGK